ncbi:MAG: hypothetical protein ACOC44_06035, partial [Promethearchaeia archaeon]
LIADNGNNIDWNVTRSGGLNFFEDKFTNYKINFTIPSSWDNIGVYNGTDDGPYMNTTRDLGNGYTDVTVYNAGNGTYWFLNATSPNLISSIDMYLKGTDETITNASKSSVVVFNVSFSQFIPTDSGTLNLSVYSPESNDNLNFTAEISDFDGGEEVSIAEWDVSENATVFNEDYRVQALWNNETSAGFREANLTIFDEVDTLLEAPETEITAIRGQNITYTCNYTDNTTEEGIEGALISETYKPSSIQSFIKEDGNGNYTIQLNTSQVNVLNSPLHYNFTVSKVAKVPQNVSLTLHIQKTQTNLTIYKFNQSLYRKDNPTQEVLLHVNDTVNDQPVLGLTTDNITVIDQGTQNDWLNNWTLKHQTGGNYSLNITIDSESYDTGRYELLLNISGFPNYNWSVTSLSFNLIGNESQINLISMRDPLGNQLNEVEELDAYEIFYDASLTVKFNMTDADLQDSLIEVDPDSYYVTYSKNGTTENGTLSPTFSFDDGNHTGIIDLSNLTTGFYTFNITVEQLNYQNATLSFNVSIISKYEVRISVEDQSEEIIAGEGFSITLKLEYRQNESAAWTILSSASVRLTSYINGEFYEERTGISDENGLVEFSFTLPSRSEKLDLQIEVETGYNYNASSFTLSDMDVTPIDSGIAWEDLMIYLILGAVAAVAVVGAVGVYKGIIQPRKLKKQRLLAEVKTMFDDAINLEHVLVLYKGSGTCIYFKSFASEDVDPEMVSGLITAVSTFGREMKSKEALSEISYGDKMILLADGEYIRVALVLAKQASVILRKHLTEFIKKFEETHSDTLPKWRGQIDVFRDSGKLIDQTLNTSIILPHEITYKFSKVKELKNPHSKVVLKVANNLVENSDRDFFFIATLLEEATEETGLETAEVFLGIKELREENILMPIDISELEEREVSQQEYRQIEQKLSEMTDLPEDEQAALVDDLAKMDAAEREAYFTSLKEKHEIKSESIQSKPGMSVLDSSKEAKDEIKNLAKKAKKQRKDGNYDEAIQILKNAAMIATNWDYNQEFLELQDKVREIRVEAYGEQMERLEKEAKKAAKQEDFAQAAQKYNQASNLASEIFKLGKTKMTKEVKRLKRKAKEYEKLT